MTYTTESFEAGSEFMVKWTDWSVNGNPINRKSEIFTTYEEADALQVANESNGNGEYANRHVFIRRPGNKRFTIAYSAKKA